jgi:histidine ammonia-lyase
VSEVVLDGENLTPQMVWHVAMGGACELDADARRRMTTSAEWYQRTQPDDIIRRKWRWLGAGDAPTETSERVRRFVEGHCAGVGRPLAPATVRAVLAARANVLATGHTGCRPEVADRLLHMLRQNVVPVVPSQGSVGSAAPAQLAHIARVAFGLGGTAWVDGTEVPAEQAVRDMPVLLPTEKEALSLLNGSTLTTAWGALCVARAHQLLDAAEAAAALSFETIRADLDCLSTHALGARGHSGAQGVAGRLRRWLRDSELVGKGRRPDAFSVRCAPVVLGGARDALEYVDGVVSRELNGACDNPLVFPGVGVIEAGNFHAAPVALALDHLKVAAVHVASISERRVFRMTHGQLSGLPSFLAPDTGLNSGLMLAQYTAASLVSEAKGLSYPGSVDSIPTVQHLEDHASMGPISAKGLDAILDILGHVVAIELLVAAQGLDFHLRAGLAPGARTKGTWEAVRELVPFWEQDRSLHPDLQAVRESVRKGTFSLRPE